MGECSLYSPREPYGDVDVERFLSARMGWGEKNKIKASNRKGVMREKGKVGGGEGKRLQSRRHWLTFTFQYTRFFLPSSLLTYARPNEFRADVCS